MKIITRQEDSIPFCEVADGECFRYTADEDMIYFKVNNASTRLAVRISDGRVMPIAMMQEVIPVSAKVVVTEWTFQNTGS